MKRPAASNVSPQSGACNTGSSGAHGACVQGAGPCGCRGAAGVGVAGSQQVRSMHAAHKPRCARPCAPPAPSSCQAGPPGSRLAPPQPCSCACVDVCAHVVCAVPKGAAALALLLALRVPMLPSPVQLQVQRAALLWRLVYKLSLQPMCMHTPCGYAIISQCKSAGASRALMQGGGGGLPQPAEPCPVPHASCRPLPHALRGGAAAGAVCVPPHAPQALLLAGYRSP